MEIKEALEALEPLTKEEILQRMVEAGIKFERHWQTVPLNEECPLARLLQQMTGKDVRVGCWGAWDNATRTSRDLNGGVRDFRYYFDNGGDFEREAKEALRA